MRPTYRDPDKPYRPEDDDPNLVPTNRMRSLTEYGFGPYPGSSWQGAIGCAVLLALVLLILWGLMSLHIFG